MAEDKYNCVRCKKEIDKDDTSNFIEAKGKYLVFKDMFGRVVKKEPHIILEITCKECMDNQCKVCMRKECIGCWKPD